MIPLATTTGTVRRSVPAGETDPYDVQPAPSVIATGVPATISSPSGSERRRGGSKETVDAHLDCAVIDLRHQDTFTDDLVGVTYSVLWVERRQGLGLDRMEAGLMRTRDLVDA